MEPASATQRVSDLTSVADAEMEPQPVAESSVLARSRRFLWPGLCFLQLGLLLGGYVLFRRVPSDAAAFDQTSSATLPEPAKHASKPTRILSPEIISPASTNPEPDDLDQGDRLIRSDRADLALPLFGALRSKVAAPLRDQIEYRTALCLERL